MKIVYSVGTRTVSVILTSLEYSKDADGRRFDGRTRYISWSCSYN